MKDRHPVQPALPFQESDAALIRAHERFCITAGHSERTLIARREIVERLALEHDLLEVTGEQIIDWLAGMRSKRTGEALSASSRATYAAHVRAFCTWMHETGRRDDNPAAAMPKIRVPKRLPRPLTPEQVAQILDACRDPRAHTTRGYVLLGAYAGLRNHEIAKVRGEDFAAGVVRVTGKGGAEYDLPLHPLIREYAETMPWRGYWFGSDTPSGHVHRCSVGLAISRAMERAQVPGTPHQLRHHFGTEVLRSTGNLRLAQRALRHANPSTTAIYTLLSDHDLAAAIGGIAMPGDDDTPAAA